MTYIPKFCDEPFCTYVTTGGTSTKCALHQESARVAASVKVVAGVPVQREPGIRDWDWCDVPGCHGAATSNWDGLSVCEKHGKYGTLVAELHGKIATLKLVLWIVSGTFAAYVAAQVIVYARG